MYPPILHYTTTLRNPRKNASPSFFFCGNFPFSLAQFVRQWAALDEKKKSLKIMIFCNNDEETIKL